jgi:hypothetical protein
MRSNPHAHIRINPEGLKWLAYRTRLNTHKDIAAAAGVDVSSVSRGINHAVGTDVMSGLMYVAVKKTGASESTAYTRLFRLVTDEPRRRERVDATT